MNDTCKWTHYPDEAHHTSWETECNYAEPFIIDDWKHCPFCGKKLEVENDSNTGKTWNRWNEI